MSEVSTVGDLSGSHVAKSTVSILYGKSDIYGTITHLEFSTTYSSTLDGTRFYTTTADITLGGIHLESVPLDTLCRLIRE